MWHFNKNGAKYSTGYVRVLAKIPDDATLERDSKNPLA